ncbi:MAG: phosphate ABC transporter permease [bacterium]|nr:phosphate ABC transporter permease [bacterium]
MISSVRNVVARRDLIWALFRGELQSGSAESRLGWLWWLLDPLLMIGVYWFFKVLVFGAGKYDPYPVFVGVALLTWRHLSTSVARSVKILRTNEALVKAVPFPTVVLPIAQSFSQFFYFSISLFVLTVIALAVGQPITPVLLQLPLLAALQLVLVAGLCMALSCVGVLVRDLEIALGHALRIGWYLSPGIYGVDLLVEKLQSKASPALAEGAIELYMMNPFAILFSGYRGALIDPHWLSPHRWGILTVEAVVVLLVGYWMYRYFDRRIIKFV